MGRDGARWQGATTLRAHAREKEQHGLKACQRAPARLNRVRSAVTQQVKCAVAMKVSIHAVHHAEQSGQLRFLGSIGLRGRWRLQRETLLYALQRKFVGRLDIGGAARRCRCRDACKNTPQACDRCSMSIEPRNRSRPLASAGHT